MEQREQNALFILRHIHRLAVDSPNKLKQQGWCENVIDTISAMARDDFVSVGMNLASSSAHSAYVDDIALYDLVKLNYLVHYQNERLIDKMIQYKTPAEFLIRQFDLTHDTVAIRRKRCGVRLSPGRRKKPSKEQYHKVNNALAQITFNGCERNEYIMFLLQLADTTQLDIGVVLDCLDGGHGIDR